MVGSLSVDRRLKFDRKKFKVVPVHDLKAYRGIRGIAPLILNLDTELSCQPTEYEAGLFSEPV
jgi:hypothetical protein